jgi:hypothetical protein
MFHYDAIRHSLLVKLHRYCALWALLGLLLLAENYFYAAPSVITAAHVKLRIYELYLSARYAPFCRHFNNFCNETCFINGGMKLKLACKVDLDYSIRRARGWCLIERKMQFTAILKVEFLLRLLVVENALK